MTETSNSHTHTQQHVDCSEVVHRIYEYLDGELQPREVARIAEHLGECGPCLNEHDLDQAVRDAVQRSQSSPQCPEVLRISIQQRITAVRYELDR